MSYIQKWLREEHDFIVEISYIIEKQTFCYIIFSKKLGIWFNAEKEDYNTYEEALEAGLKKALELIK